MLLLAVDLPLASARQRAALPFAIEDRIAEPIDDVHVALGDEIAPRRYLAGVVRHDDAAGWTELAEAGARAAMVPDVLALPIAGAGDWAVDLRGAARWCGPAMAPASRSPSKRWPIWRATARRRPAYGARLRDAARPRRSAPRRAARDTARAGARSAAGPLCPPAHA